MKIHLLPTFNKQDQGDGGIRRIIDAQRKYLPEFGIELVDDIEQADLTVGHGAIKNVKSGAPFVSHSHGLYWSEYKWGDWGHGTNKAVIDALICADAITVPSEWVKRAYTRGLLRDIQVIYHGVDVDEWKAKSDNGGYVLWNKPRHDSVSNADEVGTIAAKLPKQKFISTIITKPQPNLSSCGVTSYEAQKQIVQRAAVYLAMVRETFGIGTLEALAAGVPVAGWRYGGQEEIIIEGETGYLATPGNYDELADCIAKCLDQRERLSKNARADAFMRWQWKDKIEQYAKLYTQTLENYRVTPKVSVIVTAHNLAQYLNAAVQSVERQTLKDWECIIVDDASTDKTPEVVNSWVELDPRMIGLRSEENLKLCGARNLGISKARGKYIINLDADDELTPDALELLTSALDASPDVHIAYGSLDLIDENGGNQRANPFPGKFDWLHQMAHLNQLSYAAMMRRTVWQGVGGYKRRMWRAEDGEYWCRATSFGYRAKKVTEKTTLLYRVRADSKSANERKRFNDIDGNWCADFPWASAASGAEGAAKVKTQNYPRPFKELVPFGAPEVSGEYRTISHRQNPQVSVIIPLGAGHEQYVIDALDSLIAQTFGNWEAIVINDTGTPIESIPGAAYARVIQTQGKQGAGVARNIGLKNARAPLVLFLDADDILQKDCLRKMLDRYAVGDTNYVYTDWTQVKLDGTLKPGRAAEYNQTAHLTRGQHAVTVLMAKDDALEIGGFDEEMIGWEDNDFFIKCSINGLCGAHIPEALLVYRDFTGSRRENAKTDGERLKQVLYERYKEYIEGAKPMCGCRGGNQKAAAVAVSQNIASIKTMNEPGNPHPDYVKMQFIGAQLGAIPYAVNGHIYYGANTDENRFANVLWRDVDKLARLGVWKVVELPAPQPAPQPAPVIEEKPKEVIEVKAAAKPEPQVVKVTTAPKPVPEPVKETLKKRGRKKAGA